MAIEQNNNGGGAAMVSALLVLAIVVMAVAGWYTIQGGVSGQQVYSNHALTAHAGQAWNAVNISDAFANGKCTPQQYMCPDTNKIMRWCELARRPGDDRKPLAIGLVVGMVGTTEYIITGFASSVERWSNPGKMCK